MPDPNHPRRPARRWRRYLWYALIPFGATTLAASGLDLYGQRAVPVGTYDAIVVAGCRVTPEGLPSEPLIRRTEEAVTLWQRGVAPKIVFTGGVGDNPPAEAVAAAIHARAMGVPEDAIVIEDRSTSTEENASETARLTGARRVLVVTDNYHVFRARRVFARHFAEVDAVGVDSAWDTRARGALREVTVVTVYGILGRL